MAQIISLSEYKTAKNILGTEYDAQLSLIIGMANDYIENYCHRKFGAAEYTERNEGIVDEFGRHIFSAKNTPVISVQSIDMHYIGVPAAYAVPVSQLDIMNSEGYIYYCAPFQQGYVLRDEYEMEGYYYDITYSGGATVPPAVQLAAITMVSNNFEYLNRTSSMTSSGVQVGTKELASITIGDYSESYKNTAVGDKNGTMLTQTVKDLLAPYVTMGQSW